LEHVAINNCLVFPQTSGNGFLHGQNNFIFGPSGHLPDFCYHWRRGKVATNKELQSQQSLTSVFRQGRWVYFAPLAPTFGHFIAETIPRVWVFKAELGTDQAIDGFVVLPWSNKRGERIPLAKWGVEIFEYLGIADAQIQECVFPTVYEQLVIPQMGSGIGMAPNPEYLKFLSERQEINLKNRSPLGKRVFVSRRLARPSGRPREIIDIELLLFGAGYSEFFPEVESIETQLAVYANATHLVFEAGSAIHGLELLGSFGAKVAVIRRSAASHGYWDQIVEPRGGLCFEFGELVDPDPLSSVGVRGRPMSIDFKRIQHFFETNDFL